MTTLQEALSSFSKTLTASPPRNGLNTPEPNMDGTQNASIVSGDNSTGIGQALIVKNPSNEIGRQLGRIGAIGMPKTAEEASKLAEELVGTLLPPSMALWLAAHQFEEMTGLRMYPMVAKPEKTPEMVECIEKTVKLLSEITKPSKHRPTELAETLGKMFAAFNLFTGDAAKTNAQIEVWGEELEDFPMYAIRKAYKWAVRSERKMPSLAGFIVDVRLAVGSNVLPRQKILNQWLNA